MTDPETLMTAARDAMEHAITPYSEFPVGAAIATDDDIYRGCNIEVANYSNSMHAEAVAIAKALFDGHRTFDGLAVAATEPGVTPCGTCRQTLWEFCTPSLPVYVATPDGYTTYRLADLLPAAFGAAELTSESG